MLHPMYFSTHFSRSALLLSARGKGGIERSMCFFSHTSEVHACTSLTQLPYTFPYVYTFPKSTAASSLQREVEEREEEFMVKPKEVARTY